MGDVLPPMIPLMCEIFLLDTIPRYASRETALNRFSSMLITLVATEPSELDCSLRFFRYGWNIPAWNVAVLVWWRGWALVEQGMCFLWCWLMRLGVCDLTILEAEARSYQSWTFERTNIGSWQNTGQDFPQNTTPFTFWNRSLFCFVPDHSSYNGVNFNPQKSPQSLPPGRQNGGAPSS